MHIIDNNNIVIDDAGSWWFVKAKMWFGSGRDSASLSSCSRSLNLLCVWFCPLFKDLGLESWPLIRIVFLPDLFAFTPPPAPRTGEWKKNRVLEHIFLFWSISLLGSPLNLRKNLGNFPVSFGRERALYQLKGSKKAQIQILRDHIKKSNRRTYFSFVINIIIRVSSNSEEKFRKFPFAVWTEEGSLLAYR